MSIPAFHAVTPSGEVEYRFSMEPGREYAIRYLVEVIVNGKSYGKLVRESSRNIRFAQVGEYWGQEGKMKGLIGHCLTVHSSAQAMHRERKRYLHTKFHKFPTFKTGGAS